MKILVSIQTLAVGGAQTFAIRLSNALSLEHKVYLYVHNPRGPGNDLISLVSERVEVHQLVLNPVLDWFAWKINRTITLFAKEFSFHDFLNSWYFKYFLFNKKPDLINSHMIGSDQFVAKYSQNIPWVISMHGCYESGLSSEKDFAVKAENILRQADALIYAADKNLDVLRTINCKTLLLNRSKIYYGINDEPLQKMDRTNDKLVFGMVARSISTKGWTQALTAFRELSNNYPSRELEFLVIADESEYFKELTLKFTDVRGVKFLGFRLNPSEEIGGVDVCLLPTFFPGESLPNSVIEYLRAGKPVIATDIGEIASMVSFEGEMAGFLIPIVAASGEVDYHDILRCMEYYLNQPELLLEHQVVARKAFAKFSLEKCVNDYLDVFHKTIELKAVSSDKNILNVLQS